MITVSPPPSELAEFAAMYNLTDYPHSMNVKLSEDGRRLESDQPAQIAHRWQTPWGEWKEEVMNPVWVWLFGPGGEKRREEARANL